MVTRHQIRQLDERIESLAAELAPPNRQHVICLDVPDGFNATPEEMDAAEQRQVAEKLARGEARHDDTFVFIRWMTGKEAADCGVQDMCVVRNGAK